MLMTWGEALRGMVFSLRFLPFEMRAWSRAANYGTAGFGYPAGFCNFVFDM